MMTDAFAAPSETVGWLAGVVAIVLVALLFGVSIYQKRSFWRARLVSGAIEFIGFLILAWSLSRSMALALTLAVLGVLAMECFAVFYYFVVYRKLLGAGSGPRR